MDAEVWVVIPTYNEAANVEGIVRAAVAELERVVPSAFCILIVDDNSPDGTGEIADRLADAHPEVEVLHRSVKTGLGGAYLAGFAYALAGGAERVVVMDADFSHDPRYLEPLLDAAESADMVLGSRYVPGGAFQIGLVRRTISRGGGLYARAILGVPIRDLTSGFRCVHRRVLEAIGLETVLAKGYVCNIEISYRALLAGFRVEEIPIVCHDRTAGSSKMSTRFILEAMSAVPRLRRSAPGLVARAAETKTRIGASRVK